MTDDARCYAVRRVNPFLGVAQVVEIAGARALSNDGRHWHLQVEGERPEHTWGRAQPTRIVKQFFRFGSWHPERGLSRVPVNPILDFGAMLATNEQLIAVLQEVQHRLPFPFEDTIEHWLLDETGRPLALLAASVTARYIDQIRADTWAATLPTSGDFQAASLTALGIAPTDAHGKRHHADALERQLREAAGPAPRRCWYRRQADGGALPLQDGCEALPDAAFPTLPLRRQWDDAQQQTLVDDYLHWLAPRLLTLDTLDDSLRRELELAARHQALLVADNFRLYPKVLQQDVLDAARVEARLRRTV